MRKEKKQQKKKKRSEKGPAAETPELGTPSSPGQPQGEDLLAPKAAPTLETPAADLPGSPMARPPVVSPDGNTLA